MKAIAVIALTIVFTPVLAPLYAQQAGATDKPLWSPDQGDGTYKNPIIYADYSDPDAIRVGDDFYMVSSSFNCAPGLPILHSKDLVNWTIINHVFKQQIPQNVFSKPQHGNGVWAPAIRHHRGEFYIYYPDPDFGIYLVKTRNPAGKWSDPVLVKSAKGWIDPCPFWDDDGNVYLVHAWANSRSGIKSILTINRLNADGTKVLDEGRMVFDGRANHPTIEGPKLYKRNGYYYIFAPAGGVPTGWQTVLRSKNIYGPYEDRIVMDQGKTEINGPHQGAWVELESGESWFLHFQDQKAYGRVVHLQPMKWVNDWPVIGEDADGDGKGQPFLSHRKPNVGKRFPLAVLLTSDDFGSTKLAAQWQWQANPGESWSSLAERPGWLRLKSLPAKDGSNFWSVPNLLLQKLPAPEFSVTTKLDVSRLATGEKSGLLMMGLDYSYLAVERTEDGFRLLKIVCLEADKANQETVEASRELAGSDLLLRVGVSKGAVTTFSYSIDGRVFTVLGQPFNARQGKWIGAKVGVFALSRAENGRGHADFDWFRFSPP